MSWQGGWKQYRGKGGQQWKGGTQGKPKTHKGPPDQESYIGYDGRRVQCSVLPSSVGAQNGGKSEEKQDKASRQMEAMKQLLEQVIAQQGIELPPELKEVMQDSPGEELRQRRKELNQERKRQNRIKALEQQLAKETEAYATWRTRYKEIYKAEAKRHTERMEQIQQKLQQAKEDEREKKDDEMEEIRTSDDEELYSHEKYITEKQREGERKKQ